MHLCGSDLRPETWRLFPRSPFASRLPCNVSVSKQRQKYEELIFGIDGKNKRLRYPRPSRPRLLPFSWRGGEARHRAHGPETDRRTFAFIVNLVILNPEGVISWGFQAEKQTGTEKSTTAVGEWKDKHINFDSLADWFAQRRWGVIIRGVQEVGRTEWTPGLI